MTAERGNRGHEQRPRGRAARKGAPRAPNRFPTGGFLHRRAGGVLPGGPACSSAALWPVTTACPSSAAAEANAAAVRNFRILPGGLVNTFSGYAQPYVELALGLPPHRGAGHPAWFRGALPGCCWLVYIGGIVSLGPRRRQSTSPAAAAARPARRVRGGQDPLHPRRSCATSAYLIPAGWLPCGGPKSRFSADAALLPEPVPSAPRPHPAPPGPPAAKGGPSRRD